MDEEMEDTFNILQHDLDKDLTTTPAATEHSEPNEPPSGSNLASCSTATCSVVAMQQHPVAQASACGPRI